MSFPIIEKVLTDSQKFAAILRNNFPFKHTYTVIVGTKGAIPGQPLKTKEPNSLWKRRRLVKPVCKFLLEKVTRCNSCKKGYYSEHLFLQEH